MFEASDHDAVDKVLAFLSALVDECCDKNGTANITRVFTTYADIMDFIYSCFLDLGWSTEELKDFLEKTGIFKAAAHQT